MIVRVWRGRTARAKGDAYARFLAERAVPDYRRVEGNVDVQILRRDEADESHFLCVTRWVSESAIRAFAGDEIRKARYYPEDSGFLLDFAPEVEHWEVVASG